MQLSLERKDGMSVWYQSVSQTSWMSGKRCSIDKPSVTIMAGGMGGITFNNGSCAEIIEWT